MSVPVLLPGESFGPVSIEIPTNALMWSVLKERTTAYKRAQWLMSNASLDAFKATLVQTYKETHDG